MYKQNILRVRVIPRMTISSIVKLLLVKDGNLMGIILWNFDSLYIATFSTRDRPKGNQNTYVGQVALQPPDSLALAKYNYSRSFGVVTVKVAESKNGWQYVWKNKSPFDYDDADTVCRAMGYTHAVKNSVMTATQYQLTLNWTFHNLNKM